MRVPWTAKRYNQSILKEISPGISLEGMMLKLKLQYFGHLMQRVDSLEKTLILGGIGGRRRRGRQRLRWLDGITDSMDCSMASQSQTQLSNFHFHFHQFSSVPQSCPNLCDPMNCSTPGLPVHHQLTEFTQPMSTESVMPFNHLILCRPLLLLPSIFSNIRIFSNESALLIR